MSTQVICVSSCLRLDFFRRDFSKLEETAADVPAIKIIGTVIWFWNYIDKTIWLNKHVDMDTDLS